MAHWTDPVINWNSLSSKEIAHLIDTWGTGPAPEKAKPVLLAVKSVKAIKAAKPAVVRTKHTGADGEIKFIEHRNMYVGFMGGKVVVTKRTKEACSEFLSTFAK